MCEFCPTRIGCWCSVCESEVLPEPPGLVAVYDDPEPVVPLTPCPTPEELSDLLTVANLLLYDRGLRAYFDTQDRDGSETADDMARNLRGLYDKLRPFANRRV